MACRTIFRVWYKRWGIPRSFTDIDSLYDAATFAALIAADRIEVVREPLTPVVAEEVQRELGDDREANSLICWDTTRSGTRSRTELTLHAPTLSV
jgi:hypothetical protein